MKQKIGRYAAVLFFPVVVFGVFALASGNMGAEAVRIVLSQSCIPVCIALTMAPLFVCGLMDFSGGSRVLLAAAVGAIFGQYFGVAGMIAGCFAGGILCSVIFAVLYYYIRVPSMVISLGVLLMFEVIAAELSERFGGASSFIGVDASIRVIGMWPCNLIVTLIAILLVGVVLYRTKMGCLIKAVGGDEFLVQNLGIDSMAVKMKAFVFSGIMCGFAAVLQLCYASTLTIQTGNQTMVTVFKPMMGVLIGLSLMAFLDNLPFLITVGEIIIITLFIGFVSCGLNAEMQNIVLGVFLILLLGSTRNLSGFFARLSNMKKTASEE